MMEGAVCIVLQRCDSAELLIDNESRFAHMGRGLIVYTSFTRDATKEQLQLAAKTVLNLPLV
jgi:D-Tyr-tRNAtyr deacylase